MAHYGRLNDSRDNPNLVAGLPLLACFLNNMTALQLCPMTVLGSHHIFFHLQYTNMHICEDVMTPTFHHCCLLKCLIHQCACVRACMVSLIDFCECSLPRHLLCQQRCDIQQLYFVQIVTAVVEDTADFFFLFCTDNIQY